MTRRSIENTAIPSSAEVTAANNPIAFQYWLFTVTGQLDPTITLPAGRNHLWRVANLSANVSYVLKLCDVDSVCKDPATGLHPMTVVSEDGVQTGSRTSADGPTTLGVEVDRLLMILTACGLGLFDAVTHW